MKKDKKINNNIKINNIYYHEDKRKEKNGDESSEKDSFYKNVNCDNEDDEDNYNTCQNNQRETSLNQQSPTPNEVYYKRGSPNNWEMMNSPDDYQNRNQMNQQRIAPPQQYQRREPNSQNQRITPQQLYQGGMPNYDQIVLLSKYFGTLEIFHEPFIFSEDLLLFFIEYKHQNNNYYKLQ